MRRLGAFSWWSGGVAALVMVTASCGKAEEEAAAAGTAISSDGREDQVGSWDPVMSWPLVAIHAQMLPNGKVLFWDRGNTGGGPLLDKRWGPPRVWDPVGDPRSQKIEVAPTPG